MKVQCTLIISTFRGMAAASPWITTLSKSLGQTQPITFRSISAFDLINPNTFAYSTSASEWFKGFFVKRVYKGSSEYNNNDEDENVGKTLLSDTAKGNREHGHDERSRAFPNNDEDENVGKTVLSDTAKGNSEHGHDERSRAFPNNDEDKNVGKTVLSDTAKGNSEHGHDERSRAFPNNDEDENVGKTVLSYTAKGNSEHGHDERSRAFPKLSRPRPENVPWPAFPKSANKVDFTGMIGRPVEFNFTQSGQASARTSLAVITGPEDEPMWLHLLFWNELAEAAAEHLNKYDIVHVSGLLTSQVLAVEGAQQRIFYQVTPWRWDLVQNEAPTFSQQLDLKRNSPSQAVSQHTVVNENTWSPVVFQLTFINRVPPFQY